MRVMSSPKAEISGGAGFQPGSLSRAVVALVPAMLLAGCARSPEFNVLGSYFPGWIACILLGVVVAVIAHVLLKRWQWEARISALPLFYLSLVLLVACACWLITFE